MGGKCERNQCSGQCIYQNDTFFLLLEKIIFVTAFLSASISV